MELYACKAERGRRAQLRSSTRNRYIGVELGLIVRQREQARGRRGHKKLAQCFAFTSMCGNSWYQGLIDSYREEGMYLAPPWQNSVVCNYRYSIVTFAVWPHGHSYRQNTDSVTIFIVDLNFARYTGYTSSYVPSSP